MTRASRKIDLTLFCAALLVAGCAVTTETAPAPGPATPAPAPRPEDNPFDACARPDRDEVPILDDTREMLQETVCGAALWFDGLFGDGDLRAARRARGRLEVSQAYSQHEGHNTRVRFSARVPFPALAQRLSAFAGVDDNEDLVRDRAEGVGLRSETSALDEADDFFAGLGYLLSEAYGIRTDFRVGARGLRDTRAFAQLRMSHTAHIDVDNRLELRQTPFYNTRDGWGVTTSADFDHALSPTRLLRWGNVGTVTEHTEGADWRSALILYQSLRDLRALAFEWFERGTTAAPVPLTEYGARVIYREPMFQARLFLNFVPGYSWPRTDPALPREGSFNVSLGFELPYGDVRR